MTCLFDDVPSRRLLEQGTRRALTHSTCYPCAFDGRDQPSLCQPAPALGSPSAHPLPRRPHQFKVTAKGATHPATRMNYRLASLRGRLLRPTVPGRPTGHRGGKRGPSRFLLEGKPAARHFFLLLRWGSHTSCSRAAHVIQGCGVMAQRITPALIPCPPSKAETATGAGKLVRIPVRPQRGLPCWSKWP